jgi:hypothetical protein
MVSTGLGVCAWDAKESKKNKTTRARIARLITDSPTHFPENRQLVLKTDYTSCFVRDLQGRGGLVKAEQNIPIAKLCVYTSTRFSEEIKCF